MFCFYLLSDYFHNHIIILTVPLLKKLFFLFIVLSFHTAAQQLSLPSVGLEGISFNVKITEITDTAKVIHTEFYKEGVSYPFIFEVKNNEVDTSVTLPSGGSYHLRINGVVKEDEFIRIIPGILSIIPPLAAILLALIFRQVIVSLLLGIYFGAVFINGYNPLTGLLKVIDTYIINAIIDPSHAKIIVFTFLFGGVVGLMNKSGGTKGIAALVTRFARKRNSGMVSSWLAGLIIFFDDYANTLIVGNLMRPITDKFKVSREKLSFIVDSTSAPVASLFIISTWIGFEIGLIQDGLDSIGLNENAYDVFLSTIPYRFYPIAILMFVFLSAYTQRDFGPMLKAERRAVLEGKVTSDNSKIADPDADHKELFGSHNHSRWYNGIVPVVILIFGTIAGLIYTGMSSLQSQGISDYGIREIISNSDSYMALLWSSFTACIVAAVMIISQGIMSLHDTADAWFSGIRSMLFALIILTLAWTIGTVTVELHTADYIINLISDSIDPRFLPVLVFIACALTSFSTGTSWGTMAIMMPIVIPLGYNISGLYDYSSSEMMVIIYGVVSSVLAGSVFGDHCSPIADTTILSSMASGCDLMDHVRTQLPYAVITALICMLLGDIPTAFGFSPYISILLILGSLTAIIFFFGKKPEGN
jgi:Na+/H+ antiporter NhaC